MDGTWTITELAELAAAALAADGSAQVSGRVRDLPNERLIRWYTTIGLVDPPLGRRGRTALYGPRHLLQLVAVKRRQADGRSIAEIQFELAAATDTALERIASLPPRLAPAFDAAPASPATSEAAHRPAHRSDEPTAHPPTTDGLRRKTPQSPPASAPASRPGSPTPTAPAPPAPAAPPSEPQSPTGPTAPPTGSTTPADPATKPKDSTNAEDESPESRGSTADPPNNTNPSSGGPSSPQATRPREGFWSTRPDVAYSHATVSDDYGKPPPVVVQGVRLASGLTLLLDVPALSGDDLAAIEDAARPLLDELRRRGLLAPTETPAFLPADPSRRFP